MMAETIAHALRGRRTGRGWIALCPAHHDRLPSLSIAERDGRVLVRCFAGCTQADVIAALRGRGLWPEREHRPLSWADRQAWAESKRIQAEADHFAAAAELMADWALDELPAADPARALYTRLLTALRVSPEAEYRTWLAHEPTWAAALVVAGRERDRRLQVALATWIAAGMPQVPDAH